MPAWRDNQIKRQLQVSRRQPPAPLTREQLAFSQEYLLDLDAEAAALRAGLKAYEGRRLLSRPTIQTAIQVAKSRREKRIEIYADEVLRAWESARRVDYNEFVSVIVPPCRYCWGTNHHYQFTTLLEMGERARAHALHQTKLSRDMRYDFDTEGGEGYNILREPCRGPEWKALGYEPTADRSCPECQGAGDAARVLIRDTRYLSQGARYLYEGASRSRDGELKLNLRSRRDFDEMVGRHLGILGPSAGQIPSPDPGKMSDAQLDGILQSYGITLDDDEYQEVSQEAEPPSDDK